MPCTPMAIQQFIKSYEKELEKVERQQISVEELSDLLMVEPHLIESALAYLKNKKKVLVYA